jgi:hypothetical protein
LNGSQHGELRVLRRKSGLPFTDKHIDDFIFSVPTFRTTMNFRF